MDDILREIGDDVKDAMRSDGGSVSPKSTADKPDAPIIAKKTAQPADAAIPAPAAESVPYKVYSSPALIDDPVRRSDSVSVAATPLEPLPPTPAIANAGYFPLLPFGASNAPPQFIPLATNHPLNEDMGAITRAVIFVHDVSRNAGEGVATLNMLAGTSGAKTLIIAPQFLLPIDIARFSKFLPEDGRVMARWPFASAPGWQIGGDSISTTSSQKGISSFTAVDMLLLYLANRQNYPALQQIIVAGHGSGGDFALRYAAAGLAPDLIANQGLSVSFLAANPSSYLYLTALRPVAQGTGFHAADAASCPGVNNYPYGLGELVPYARRSGGNAVRMKYPERKVTVILGAKTGGDPFPDTGCAAEAQGRDRLERGRNYERYMFTSFGDSMRSTQKFVTIPNAGYDPIATLGSACGMAVMFGGGECMDSTRVN